MNEAPEIVNKAFDAWIKDITTEYDLEGTYQPIMQAEIISLACMWSIANVKFNKQPRTVYDFTQDVLAHDSLPGVWHDYATFAGDPSLRIDELPYARYMEILNSQGDWSPYAFERYAAQDGHPDTRETISGIERSLIGALGHAAYNCTNGGRYLVLRPTFGPPPGETFSFLQSAGDNVIEFTQNNLM